MLSRTLLVLLIVWGQDLARCVTITAPAHIAVGDEAFLGCEFDLGDELLYSVKWYKDNEEFYRYVPKQEPNQMVFKAPGVRVDLSRSSSDVLTLTNVQPESAGVYRCEVTGEAPRFIQKQDEKYITVHVLPRKRPQITGLKFKYQIGDRLSANCTAPGSRPEANLKWLVNKKPVHRAHLRGPWRRVVDDKYDVIETTLGVHFMVLPSHYRNNVMEVKCQAMIVPLYQKEIAFAFYAPKQEEESEEETEEPDTIIPPTGDDDGSDDDDDDIGSLDDLLPDEGQKKVLKDEFKKVLNELDLETLPIVTSETTETPENSTDCATQSSAWLLEAMALAVLMHLILFISNEHVLEDYL